MTMIININTNMEIKNLKDLKKLRTLLEENNLSKPNYSAISKELGVDRRTVKKYYEAKEDLKRKKRASRIDEYRDIIEKLLFPIDPSEAQKFYYKSHLHRYLKREHGLNCATNTFNHYILNDEKLCGYFSGKKSINSIISEKPFGVQAQFDWKEKLKFRFKDGTEIILNVACLVLSASRFKVWKAYPATSQNCLFDFFANSLETIGGVPKELLVDNAATMMDIARSRKSKGKVNIKFQQLADDFGFEIKPCMARRPNTKAKVESPMKLIDEIMNYNGVLKDFEELENKLEQLNNEANARISQATGYAPVLVFKKEKEHLLPLPNSKVCSFYKIKTFKLKVNQSSMITFKENMYSVPSEYIGKNVNVHTEIDELHVYYNKKMITMHSISDKKINYHEEHHFDMCKNTFRNKENVEEFANKHLKELKQFHEQLSAVT